MNINRNTFCVVPFVQINTRGKGDPRVCCSISGLDYGIPKDLTIDQLDETTYNKNTEVFNLSVDSIEELWNSGFMKDFRMKMLNGVEIPNCEFCHRMEKSGLTSKRTGKNARFLEKVEGKLEGYYKNNGEVDVMPQWWEIRLSTKCNLSCVMCTPGLSSMMYKEYKKWDKKGKLIPVMKGNLDIAESDKDYLSKSKFFKNQIIKNLSHVSFMEFRGGEVFADKDSINFINEISKTEFAKNIILDISTNATLIDKKIVEILSRFKGGTLKFSIDAVESEDEFIRYHTDWDRVIESMKISGNLHNGWKFLTQTTLQLLNCLSMDKLILFLNDFILEGHLKRFYIGFTTVRGKDWLRHEIVSIDERNKQIEKLKKLREELPIFVTHESKEHHIRAINRLITALGSPEATNALDKQKAKDFFVHLSNLRNIDYLEKFPHLKTL